MALASMRQDRADEMSNARLLQYLDLFESLATLKRSLLQQRQHFESQLIEIDIRHTQERTFRV